MAKQMPQTVHRNSLGHLKCLLFFFSGLGGNQYDYRTDHSAGGGQPQHKRNIHQTAGCHCNHIADGDGACQVALCPDSVFLAHNLTGIGDRGDGIQTVAYDLCCVCQVDTHGTIGKGNAQAFEQEHKAGEL